MAHGGADQRLSFRLDRRRAIQVASDLRESDHPYIGVAGRRQYAELKGPERLELRDQRLPEASIQVTPPPLLPLPHGLAQRRAGRMQAPTWNLQSWR